MTPAQKPLYNISEAAKILGVAAVTLRLWERQGKITSTRTAGGQRRYTAGDLEVIRQMPHSRSASLIPEVPTPKFQFQLSPFQKRVLKGFIIAVIISSVGFVTARSGLIPSPAPLISNLYSLFSKPRAASTINHELSTIVRGAVLASQTTLEELRATFNVLTLFRKDVQIEGRLTAPNIIYSLTAGDNITITPGQRPTISATDQTTGLKIFKTIKVGDTTFSAGSKTDTLTFAAGDNASVAIDTSNKKLTFSSTVPSAYTGWTDDGTIVRLTTAGDLVNIGSATGAAKLSIEGGSYAGDVITASSAGNLLLKLSQTGTLSLSGDFLPTAPSTYDIGSLATPWANIYADNLISGSTGVVGYWQRNGGALSPANITDDFLVGGTSTASALFRVTSGTGLVTLPNSNTLTGQTGNVQFSGGISVGGGTTYYINSSGNTNFNTLNAATTTLGPTTVTSLSDSGSASISGALTLYGTPTIASTSKQSLVIGNSDTGNIVFAQPITTGTWNASAVGATFGGTGLNSYTAGDLLFSPATDTLDQLPIGNPNQVLTVSGSNLPAWTDTTSVGNWQRIAGALSPLNITDDVLVGGISTASATFRIASATGDVTSGTINSQTISSTANFTGTVNIASSASISGILTLASSLGSEAMTTLAIGNITTGNIALDPGSGLLTLAQDDDFLPATATGTSDIGSSGVPWDNIYSTTIYQAGSQVCDTSGNCLGGANDLWGLANGTYYPRYYSTVDVLIGSNATSSAKFAFMNVASGTPTASISGNIVLDAAGVISTTRNQDLTLTGGRVLLNSVPLLAPLPVSITDTAINGTLRQSIVDAINDLYTLASGGAGSSGYWQLINKVISPSNSTFDLALGETATGSAKFQIFGTTGSATSAGNLTFSSAATIATTARQTLNIGGTTTGTIAIANPTAVTSTSTGTELTSGSLFSMYWNPGSSTTTTGNLFNLNVGANALISGNIFNVQDNGSNLFSINQTGITAALPASFTSPGDVSVAYDLLFTNPTSSYIKSAAPLYIQAGETFNSSDLTLRTFNKGNTIIDSEAFVTNYAATVAGKLVVGTTTPSAGDIGNFYLTNSAVWGKALAILNQTEGQDIFTASASGVTKLTINNAGNLTTAGTITLPNTNTLTGVSGYFQASAGISVGGATTYYINNLGTANLNAATVNSTLNVTGTTTLTGALIAQSTASVSGALTLYGTPTIATTAKQSLTLGDTDTGDINIPGLSASAGVYTDASKNLTSSPPTSGILGYWQRASGALAPANITDDLLLGGTATSSALFAISGTTGSASTSGTLTFGSTATIATTSKRSLTIGDTNTGNIQLAAGSATPAFVLTTAGQVGIGTTGPDAALEINHATGDSLRLTYNDSNGSATNYTDFSLDSTGGLTLTGSAATLGASATAEKTFLTLTPGIITLTAPTAVTSLMETAVLTGATIAADSATTVNKATTLSLVAPIDSTNATLTDDSALRILNVTSGAGVLTNQYGLYIEDLTSGATADYGIYIAGADTYSLYTAAGSVGHVFEAGESLAINAATTDNTTTAGVIDLNVDTVTTGNIGLNIDHIIRDSAGITAYGAKINQTIDDDSGESSTGYGLYIAGANNDASSTLTALYVDAGTGTGTEYAAAFMNGNVGIGTTGPDAALEINHATGDSLRLTYNDSNGSATNYTDFSLDSTGGLTLTGSAASVASATSAEKTFLTLTPATITLTGTTQVTSLMDSYLINRATIAGDTPTVTVDDAATLTVAGPPAEGSNVSLTEAYALKINTAATTATTAYGLYVDAPTGAGANYAAIFQGGNVGIGTTAGYVGNGPTLANLQINSSSDTNNYLSFNDDSWSSNGTRKSLSWNADPTKVGEIALVKVSTNGFGMRFSTYNTGIVTDAVNISPAGLLGVGTTAPDAALEINHATGDSLRLTYNDSDGSAQNYTDFSLDSTGGLTLTGSAASIASATSAEKTFLTLTPATITLTGTTQVTSLMDTYQFNRTTITGDTATVTVDDAATLTIAGPPAEGSNVSLTEAYALKINTAATTATTAYGLYVDAPTGAGTNIAAIFMGGSVGVGTSTLLNEFNVAGAATVSSSLALGVQSGPPVTCDAANEGRIYYHGTAAEKKLYFCNGTTWTAIAQGSGGDTTAVISPEYPGAVISADGTNNVGTLTSDREATGAGSLYNFNYYEFSSGQSSLQDYDVYIRFKIPENFASWTTSNALIVDFETEDTTNTNNKVDATVYKDNDADTVSSATNVSNYATTWHSDQLGSATLTFTAAQLNTGITWAAGDVMIVKLKLYSKDNYFARVGSIKFDWQ